MWDMKCKARKQGRCTCTCRCCKIDKVTIHNYLNVRTSEEHVLSLSVSRWVSLTCFRFLSKQSFEITHLLWVHCNTYTRALTAVSVAMHCSYLVATVFRLKIRHSRKFSHWNNWRFWCQNCWKARVLNNWKSNSSTRLVDTHEHIPLFTWNSETSSFVWRQDFIYTCMLLSQYNGSHEFARLFHFLNMLLVWLNMTGMQYSDLVRWRSESHCRTSTTGDS